MLPPFFLYDVLEIKRDRGDADAEQFRALMQYEFASGLSATMKGAATSLRRWIEHRRPEISDVMHARRVAALRDIEAVRGD